MNTPNRVVKTKIPLRVIVSSTLIGVFVMGFIVFAVWQSGRGIADARLRGTIVTKEYRPNPAPEREITLSRTGALSARDATGEYVITVEVPQRDGSRRTFTVWLNDRQRFDDVKVGDSFDVGPFLVPSR